MRCMKTLIRMIATIALITLAVVFIAVHVFAHPGRTDSYGGHTNHSTGEYHYHHGYPEHDHYDMDRDGDIDCPYDFRDNTKENRSGQSGDTKTPDAPISNAKSSKTLWDIISLIFDHLLLGVGIWFNSSYLLSFIFLSIFEEKQGCFLSMIVGAVISIPVCIWLLL